MTTATASVAPIVEHTLTGRTDDVWAVAVAQLDSRPVIVTGSSDNTVRVWDLATPGPAQEPRAHARSVRSTST